MGQRKKQLLKRYHKLVDRRVRKKITLKEKRELDQIQRTLNLNEFGEIRYRQMASQLAESNRELARVGKLVKRVKKMQKLLLARQK
jgi:hypothetical protein